LSLLHGSEERLRVQRYRHDASTVTAAVGEKALLGMK